MENNPLVSPHIEKIRTYEGHEGIVFGFEIVRFEESKNSIISNSGDSIRIFSEDSSEAYVTIKHDTMMYSMEYIPETKQILVADYSGHLCLFNIFPEPKILKKIQVSANMTLLWKITRVSPNCFFCCVGALSCDRGNLYKISFPPKVFCAPQPNQETSQDLSEIVVKKVEYPVLNSLKESLWCIYQLRLSPSQIVFSGGNYTNWKDMRLKFCDWETGKYLYCFENIHSNIVLVLNSYIYKETEERLLSGSNDGEIIVWNMDGDVLKKVNTYHPTYSILVSESFDFFLSGDSFGNVSYFNLMKLKEFSKVLKIGNVHSKEIRKLEFNKNQSLLYSSSGDCTLSVQKFEDYISPIRKFEKDCELKNYHDKWIYDLVLIRKYNILVSCSSDNKIKFYDITERRKLDFEIQHSENILKLYYWEDKQSLIFIDFHAELYILDIDFSGDELKLRSKKFYVKVGEKMNWFINLKQYGNSNRFVTFCGYGKENKGELREIVINYEEEKKSYVDVLYKINDGIYAAYFSILKPHILYFAGKADHPFQPGKFDLALKKYCFKTKKKDVKEFLIKENEAVVSSIFSYVDVLSGKEIVIVGNCSSELFFLRDEKLFRRMKLFGGIVYGFAMFSNSVILIQTFDNFLFLDSRNFECRILSSGDCGKENAKFLKNKNLVFYCVNDFEEEEYSIRIFSAESGNEDIDEFERVEYVNELDVSDDGIKIKFLNYEIFVERFFLNL